MDDSIVEKKKNYATTMSFNKTCMFKRDFSHYVNHKCLGCKFCYRHAVPGTKSKRYEPAQLKSEEKISPYLYQVPITVSRYCDPLFSASAHRKSNEVVSRILDAGGQVILKSSQAPVIRETYDYAKNIQVQGRVVSADTRTGKAVRDLIAPEFGDTLTILESLRETLSHGAQAALIFDPLILGLNDSDLYIIAHQAQNFGITKIIVKQLFATDYFKGFLATNVGKDCANLLSEKVGPFWTYKNELLLHCMNGVLQDTRECGITFSMCSNKAINSLLNNCNNCCQFENPIGIYNIKQTGKGRFPSIINLKDK